MQPSLVLTSERRFLTIVDEAETVDDIPETDIEGFSINALRNFHCLHRSKRHMKNLKAIMLVLRKFDCIKMSSKPVAK